MEVLEGQQGADGQQEPQELSCPECEAAGEPRTFPTAAGLGRHRSSAHGIPGSTTGRKNSSRRSRSGRGPGRPRNDDVEGFDAAKALKSVDNGQPLTPERLSRLQAWLVEGEKLYRGK